MGEKHTVKQSDGKWIAVHHAGGSAPNRLYLLFGSKTGLMIFWREKVDVKKYGLIFIGISIHLIMYPKKWNTYCHTIGTANNRTELRENEQWLKFISDLFIVTFSNTFPLHQTVASARTNCPTELSLSLFIENLYLHSFGGTARF